MAVLTRETLSGRVDDFVALDRATLEEAWGSREFLLELPGKWELSRLALDWTGRVAGFAVASIKPTGVHVHRLVVAAGFRGRGLGRALLKSVAADAAGRGVSTLTLKVGVSNEEARRFYENLGFDESGRDPRNVALTVRVSALLATGQAR
jgi:ribosomal-protein-alanine N-acetyltransferase